jgi:hypothetical protein
MKQNVAMKNKKKLITQINATSINRGSADENK